MRFYLFVCLFSDRYSQRFCDVIKIHLNSWGDGRQQTSELWMYVWAGRDRRSSSSLQSAPPTAFLILMSRCPSAFYRAGPTAVPRKRTCLRCRDTGPKRVAVCACRLPGHTSRHRLGPCATTCTLDPREAATVSICTIHACLVRNMQCCASSGCGLLETRKKQL